MTTPLCRTNSERPRHYAGRAVGDPATMPDGQWETPPLCRTDSGRPHPGASDHGYHLRHLGVIWVSFWCHLGVGCLALGVNTAELTWHPERQTACRPVVTLEGARPESSGPWRRDRVDFGHWSPRDAWLLVSLTLSDLLSIKNGVFDGFIVHGNLPLMVIIVIQNIFILQTILSILRWHLSGLWLRNTTACLS